jgi:beta-glucosidase
VLGDNGSGELERGRLITDAAANGIYLGPVLHGRYPEHAPPAPGLPIFVTENGCAAEDYVNPAGEVNDVERVRYLHTHLEAAARAIKDGASLAGYFVWSLLDNFEWSWGYQRRFGIVFVDFGTQRRIPKASAAFYANVVRANAIPLLPAT